MRHSLALGIATLAIGGACSSGTASDTPDGGGALSLRDGGSGGSEGLGTGGAPVHGTGGIGLGQSSGGGGGATGGAGSANTDLPTFVRSELERAGDTSSDAASVASVVRGNTEFGFALYKQTAMPGENLFFSPFSITAALAMTWAGAKGKTATEIANVFHFGDPVATHAAMNAVLQRVSVQDAQLTVNVANTFWVAPSIHPLEPYLDTLALNYGAGVGVVDFGESERAAALMNGWFARETHDLITDLISPTDLDGFTTLVLANAVYFKALWANYFYEGATRDDSFALESGATVPVRMMSSTMSVPYAQTPDYQAAALPYLGRSGRGFEIIVVLPTNGLAGFEADLDATKLADVLATLRIDRIGVDLPRFKMRSKLELKDALEAMGMPTAFSGADLTGIADDPPPGVLTKVLHQGYIEVDEHGTEAAGATAVIAADGSASFYDAAPPLLRLDRPFLVLIRHAQTGAVLFMGRVMRPAE